MGEIEIDPQFWRASARRSFVFVKQLLWAAPTRSTMPPAPAGQGAVAEARFAGGA